MFMSSWSARSVRRSTGAREKRKGSSAAQRNDIQSLQKNVSAKGSAYARESSTVTTRDFSSNSTSTTKSSGVM
jgi:hypothetical protein